MSEPTTAARTRLPHTGLRTPDDRFKVTSLKELETRDGIALTATLRRNRAIVGTIENSGYGGPTEFYSKHSRRDPDALTEEQLFEYAGQCVTEGGGTVDCEALLNALVDEYDWTRRIKKTENRNHAKLRLMGFILDGANKPVGEPYARDDLDFTAPASRLNLTHVRDTLMRQRPPAEFGWWQLWRDGQWMDVTVRPGDVPANLYY
jgi:hypothetical protein